MSEQKHHLPPPFQRNEVPVGHDGATGLIAGDDQVSYYVTGAKAKIRISANAKLASDWDAAKPDENVEHYQAKLKELYEKFRPWIDGGEKGILEPELTIQESD